MPTNVIGLHIGPESFNLVQLALEKKSFRVAGFSRIPLLAGATLESARPSILKQLKDFLRAQNAKNSDVIVSLPQAEVMIRYFEMARLPRKEWPAAIKFEAKKYIPFKIEEVICDFQVLEDKEDLMKVIFVAVKKAIAQEYLSIFREAGFNVTVVEAAPMGLMRVFYCIPDIKRDTTYASVFFDSGELTIDIIHNDILYFTRSISLRADEDLIEVHTPEEQAYHPDKKDILLENMASEVQLCLGYFKRQFPKLDISQLVICGGPEMKKAQEVLAKELDVPAVLQDALARIEGARSMPRGLAIAAGLALRNFEKPKIAINLLEEKKVSFLVQREMFSKIAGAEAAAAILILVLMQGLFTARVNKAQGELEQLKKAAVKTDAAGIETSSDHLMAMRERLKGRSDALASLCGNRGTVTYKLNELAALLPAGLWLERAEYRDAGGSAGPTPPLGLPRAARAGKITAGRQLVFSGSAYSSDGKQVDVINQFISNMKKEDRFLDGLDNVKLESVQFTKLKELLEVAQFRIVCTDEKTAAGAE